MSNLKNLVWNLKNLDLSPKEKLMQIAVAPLAAAADAIEYGSALAKTAKGEHVQNVQVNGEKVYDNVTAAEKTYDTYMTIKNMLTPEQWKTVGSLALRLAGVKYPFLLNVDWQKVIDIANTVANGGGEELLNSFDWRGLANNLIAQKAASVGVPDEAIEQMLSLVNTLIGSSENATVSIESDM